LTSPTILLRSGARVIRRHLRCEKNTREKQQADLPIGAGRISEIRPRTTGSNPGIVAYFRNGESPPGFGVR
jgi:hypothetical protein